MLGRRDPKQTRSLIKSQFKQIKYCTSLDLITNIYVYVKKLASAKIGNKSPEYKKPLLLPLTLNSTDLA